jgi:hypothetical protein
MAQLLCHLVGDYVLQNHWCALNKTRRTWPCVVHCALYLLPFLLLTQRPGALAVIVVTHFFIDRFRLALYWCEFWGVGREGKVCARLREQKVRRHCQNEVMKETGIPYLGRGESSRADDIWQRAGAMYRSEHPEPDPAPPWLSGWLLIIVDNTLHLFINAVALVYLG